MLESLNNYKQSLDNEGIIFTFCGPMSHDIVEGIGGALRNKMAEDEVSRVVSLKVFSIFVEQVQNVINYSQERVPSNSEMSFGIVVVGEKNNKFFIMGGNRIENSKVPKLQENLKELQGMNKDELKELYKRKRKEGADKDSKGAGIGFIEMARKSSEPIEFNFEKLDEKNSFFTINIRV
jgi:hypothetical protein